MVIKQDSNTQLFPFALVRIGGEPFSILKELQFEQEDLFNKIKQIRLMIADEQVKLNQQLFIYIQSIDDRKFQQLAQNVRRDIHNNRIPKEKELAQLHVIVPAVLALLLKNYFELIRQERNLLEEHSREYSKFAADSKNALLKLSASNVLQRGLALSSEVFLKELRRSLDDPLNISAKEYGRLEQTVIKYLSRIAAKTSPFGTFTNLDAVPINKHVAEGDSLKVTSVVRLNNELYSYIKGLFSAHAQIYPYLFLRLNPTLSLVDTSLHFLTNNYQVESFQQIETNSVLDYVIRTLEQSTDNTTFGTLEKKLKEEIDDTEENIHQYLLQLVSFGLLEFDFEVSGTDTEWDTKLIEKLNTSPLVMAPFSMELVLVLRTMRFLATQYVNADVEKRMKIIDQAFARYKDICLRIHESAGLPSSEREPIIVKPVISLKKPTHGEVIVPEPKPFVKISQTAFRFKRENIFYEDSRIASGYKLNDDKVNIFVNKLSRMLHEFRLFQYEAKEMTEMYSFYMQTNGGEEETSLLKFYELYYKEIKTTAYQEKQKSLPGNETEKQWRTNCLSYFESKINSEEIKIRIEDLEKINELSGVTSKPIQKGSYAAFIQFFKESKVPLRGVLNSSMIGYGKLFSRFLHLFDPQVTETIQKWNKKFTTEDILLLENKDSSHFNANLHPPLMPMEICTPGAQNSLKGENLVLIADVFVKPDHEKKTLNLIDRNSGKQIQIFDLGFQSVKSRSQLFQLLSRFNPTQQLSPVHLQNCINSLAVSEARKRGDTIFVYPRIVIEEDIVIQRKSWHIANKLLPLPRQNESKADYYLRVNLWLETNEIPEEVFVTINPGRVVGGSSKIGRDDYKPQYIHFKNPSLVNLWVKLIQKGIPQIKMEEMLPQPADQTCFNEKPHACESLIQWYNY